MDMQALTNFIGNKEHFLKDGIYKAVNKMSENRGTLTYHQNDTYT